MNDKNQIPSQNQTVASDQKLSNAQTQPQAPTLQGQTQTSTQQPQTVGVGSLVKEHGPVETGDVRPSSPEPEIHSEVEQIVVKSEPEFPEVKPEHKAIGLEPAKESVPVQTAPSGLSQIPMTEEEAKQEQKHEKPTNSNWGRLALFIKFFKSIHHNLIQNSKFKIQNYK